MGGIFIYAGGKYTVVLFGGRDTGSPQLYFFGPALIGFKTV